MSRPLVALVTVASDSYLDFAADLMDSAREHFLPGHPATFVTLPGKEGWPVGTECRHGIFARWVEEHEPVIAFLCDADMLFETAVSATEVLPPSPGIVATLHPGYVGQPRAMLPYEPRPESRAYLALDEGEHYYAGGFVGGTCAEILALSEAIDLMIREERVEGREVCWHDESCLNRLLFDKPPVLTLSPAMCYPDHDTYYVESVWGGQAYERRLVALDKSPAERVGR
jgi:histo-blood group ABO system transferase